MGWILLDKYDNLRAVANFEEIDMVVTRDLGLVWADEYEPFSALKADRERRLYGIGFLMGGDPWDDIIENPDDLDDGDEWDNGDDFEWWRK